MQICGKFQFICIIKDKRIKESRVDTNGQDTVQTVNMCLINYYRF